ncbi:Riboflavin transporter [Rhodobacteraceae bacterium THAF1]|uniref:DMT family transporter n=1 Tax=Palleronia sp. THAF1 TaxID=2587842 RepID=UPI000F3BFCC2|nr:DMT family transporter [Palleronia sp. THAF1]QFU08972.1 Riboflavin transporter [Palleronia sp. THAF1]VDC24289.1 Riboflavin transporter [Rhodobacteraceae bacterium THAF1]
MTDAAAFRRAALWMSGAIASFSLMAIAGRAVSFELDTFELMTYRSLIGIVLVVTVAGAMGKLRHVRAHRMGLHLVRNVFHFAGQNLWFYAITVIPLAQVFALEFTSPIWVALAAPLVLSERLTSTRILSALVGFAGILIVARPGATEIGPGQITAALAAIGFAGSALFTRRLTRTESIVSILFWLTVMQAILGLICGWFDGSFAWPSAVTWPWLALIGCAGLSAHLCLTTALSLAPASVVMPIDFLRLPVIALVGMALYAEPVDPWVILGGIVIFGANWINIRAASRNAG